MELQILVRRKMINRLERELKNLERADLRIPNDEREYDIKLHRELLNFLLRM